MSHRPTLKTDHDEPLIGLLVEDNGHEVVHYFTSNDADDDSAAATTVEAALNAIGAFRDLDWDEMIDGLDHIRHESAPTPPIEL